MKWKTGWRAGERDKMWAVQQGLADERTVASVWTSGLRIYSPIEEVHSWKTNSFHMVMMAVAPLGSHLSAAKWPTSSVCRETSRRTSKTQALLQSR